MPVCKRCATQKPKAAFRTRRQTCRACEVETQDTRRKRVRKGTRSQVLSYLLLHPCVDCGETDPAVLEFDHRERGDKELPVASMVTQGYGWDRVIAEIDKCDVRCANCHRRRTAKQMGWYARGPAKCRTNKRSGRA